MAKSICYEAKDGHLFRFCPICGAKLERGEDLGTRECRNYLPQKCPKWHFWDEGSEARLVDGEIHYWEVCPQRNAVWHLD